MAIAFPEPAPAAALARNRLRWTKRGLVFGPAMAPGRPWLDAFAQAPSTLVFDDFVRVYFSCRPPPDAQGRYVSLAAFVDLDRRDLTRIVRVAERPVMGLGATGTFDEFGTYPFSVARRDDGIVAYYGGWTRCESVPFDVAIGCALSRDGGETFERLGPGPVLAAGPHEPFIVGGPKVRRFAGRWRLFYIAGRKWKEVDGRCEPVYRLRLASSDDGIRWERQGRDLVPPRVEPDEAQASPDAIFAGGRYHLFFCYRHSAGFRTGERGYRIGYAHSADLENWTRDDGRAGLEPSAQGWDSQMVSYPHVFELDGRTHMLYLGNEFGRHGFGLATLEGSLT